jgi:hypothetical protein
LNVVKSGDHLYVIVFSSYKYVSIIIKTIITEEFR